MMNKKTFLSIFFALAAAMSSRAEIKDTIRLHNIDIVSNLKEHGSMRLQPASVSLLGPQAIEDNHVTSLKGLSTVVPNLFIPDYGSRLTSAVYIRGIGSRINTPAVGLYVDNVPYFDKSAFDFNFYDIEGIEVMRGPQGTLYGRNTMGGIIKVRTRNPLNYQGTTLNAGFTTRDNRRRVSLMHYHRPSSKLAFSGGGYYEGSDGIFQNDITGCKVDALQAFGGKFRALWLPTQRLSFDINASYDYSDEGAYPYYYAGAVSGTEQYPQYIGKITNNHENRYRRNLLNTSVGITYQGRSFVMNSMTSFQNLCDRMFLDQDFMQPDIYTIEQRQRINTLNEELTFRNTNDRRWERVSGLSVMQQWTHTTGPVTFYDDGLAWLSSQINSNFPASAPPMKISFNGSSLEMGGTFDTPTFNAALFHQSTYHFSSHLSGAFGIRFDYEKNSIDYDAPAAIDYRFAMPTMARIIPQLAGFDMHSDINEFLGTMHTDYLSVLPKFSLKWDFNRKNSMYVTVSKGMRSGGYNVQMFSELIQSAMKVKMMDNTKSNLFSLIDASTLLAAQKQMIKNTIGSYMPQYDMADVSQVEYKPEYSWNYEVGTHLSFGPQMALPYGKGSFDAVELSAALFYIHTNDQQIARFVNSGLGRMMVNAGSSESLGGELSATCHILPCLVLTTNYGYTQAKFIDYDGGSADYSGNYVPYVPQHTINADVAYTVSLNQKPFFQSLTFGVTYNGAGRVYWTEDNNASQPYYQTLGARVALKTRLFDLNLWARNITNNEYNTFYFVSASRGYEQHCRPFQLGIDLKLEF